MKHMENPTHKYDIFISYRRDGSAELATLTKEKMESAGYSVFLDVESMRAGNFDEKLYTVIEQCRDFIVVLPPGGLDRCHDEKDWVRKELKHALDYKKNVIPFMMDGFEMPTGEDLPKDIKKISKKNGVRYNHEYSKASFEKLISFLKSSDKKRTKKTVLISLVTAALMVAATALAVNLMPQSNRNTNVVFAENNTQELDYKSVYKSFLFDYLKEHNEEYLRFGLAYIDDDDVPELFITPGGLSVKAGPEFYSITNNEIVSLGKLPGAYGGFLYGEKTGFYVYNCGHSGIWWTEIYKLTKNGFELLWSAEANYTDDESAVSQSLGKEEYEKYLEYKRKNGPKETLVDDEIHKKVYECLKQFLIEENVFSFEWKYIDSVTGDYDDIHGDYTIEKYWSNFSRKYKNSVAEELTYDEFIKEYNSFLPENLISMRGQTAFLYDRITKTCPEYEFNEENINIVLS